MSEPNIAINLTLRKESWENFFESVRHQKTKIHSISNFWASVQSLEAQLALDKGEICPITGKQI